MNRYYDECQVDYSMIWGTDDHLSMHYGYHDEEHPGIEEAVINLTRVVATKAGIDEDDHVLDAGCGVGGSAVWIADNLGAEVTGININGQQIEKARAGARREGVDDLVDFEVMDYTSTEFDDDTFEVIWMVESACHADSKKELLEEMKRILKPDGRIVVADGFLGHRNLTEEQREAVDGMLEGMAAPNLDTVDEFRENLRETGFSKVDFEDKFDSVKPSAKKMYYITLLAFPLAKLLGFLGVRSETQTNHLKAAYHQYPMLKEGVWVHGLFYAEN